MLERISNISLDRLHDKFEAAYGFLYEFDESYNWVPEAAAGFDRIMEIPEAKDLVVRFNRMRGDLISSDREAAAFVMSFTAMV